VTYKEKIMRLSQICKIINAMPPHSTDGGAVGVCAYVNMENYTDICIIIQQGVGAVARITVEKSASGVGAGTAIEYNYQICNTAYQAAAGDL
jgi:hypothetical protein